MLVLIEWAGASLSVLLGQQKALEVRFLEGPYYVGLTLGAPGQCRMKLVEDRLSPIVLTECDALIRPLVQSVVQASDEILAVCHEKGWEDQYSSQLVSLVARLKEALVQP